MKRLTGYSQYFLRNPMVVKELIGHSTVTKHDIVYDIGAGSGIISSVLAERAKKVVAIEFEPRIAETLRTNMAQYPNVKVVEGDFMTLPLPSGAYKIFANIPFHLSSPIVRKITEATNPPTATYLIVQKQFGNKLLPDSDTFTGQLGILIGPLFATRIRKRLQRTDYWPHPNVDTVMVELLKRDQPLIQLTDMPAYRQFVTDCFSTPKVFARAPRSSIGLPPDIKPSQMRLKQWIKLFELHQQQPPQFRR
jgi:23S rRNA (adenine-N6)-dimethyltransferase